MGAIVTKSCRRRPFGKTCGREPQFRLEHCARCAAAQKSAPAFWPSAAARNSKSCWRIRAARSGRKKDDGAWTIPKGLAEAGEDLLATAQREFTEETNLDSPHGRLHRAHAGQAEERQGRARLGLSKPTSILPHLPATRSRSSGRQKSGRRQSFPEIDRVAYFTLPVAMSKDFAYQRPLLAHAAANWRHRQAWLCFLQFCLLARCVRPIDFVVRQHPRFAPRRFAPFVPGRQRHDGAHVVAAPQRSPRPRKCESARRPARTWRRPRRMHRNRNGPPAPNARGIRSRSHRCAPRRLWHLGVERTRLSPAAGHSSAIDAAAAENPRMHFRCDRARMCARRRRRGHKPASGNFSARYSRIASDSQTRTRRQQAPAPCRHRSIGRHPPLEVRRIERNQRFLECDAGDLHRQPWPERP